MNTQSFGIEPKESLMILWRVFYSGRFQSFNDPVWKYFDWTAYRFRNTCVSYSKNKKDDWKCQINTV